MSDIAQRLPIEEVLTGLEIIKLPDGGIPLAAIVLVKFLDSDGREQWCRRHTEHVRLVESVGALRSFLALDEADVITMYQGVDVGDDFDAEDED